MSYRILTNIAVANKDSVFVSVSHSYLKDKKKMWGLYLWTERKRDYICYIIMSETNKVLFFLFLFFCFCFWVSKCQREVVVI